PPKGVLTAQKAPPVRVTRNLTPIDWKQVKPDVRVYDLGQNMVGRARIEVYGPRGSRVVMRYSERVNADGSIHRDEIDCYHHQGPFQQEEYTLRGSTFMAPEKYESRFTYHGFRYVEVTILPPDDPATRCQDGVSPELATVGAGNLPCVESLTGRVLHTDFGETGRFISSNDLINRTQANTLWSYRGNFVGIPTDCPHREKNGWTGDAQLACAMAMYNFDNAPAYVQWLRSVREEQSESGNFTGIAPSQNWGWWAGPAWDSAIIVIPWYLYTYTGDIQPLREHYDSMVRFNDYLYDKMESDPNHVVDMSLGDWVPAKTVTPQGVTSTGYLYFDTVALSQIAKILGKSDDASRFSQRADIVRENFRKAYLKSDGTVSIGSQTAESTAIFMGFVTDPQERSLVAQKLVAAVEGGDYRIDTGIFGAKYLFRTLSETGNHDLAYRIMMGREPPGYGAWLESDATTLWEAWSLKDAWAASLNHVMFGDISGWFHEYLAGIQLSQNPDQPLTHDPSGVAFRKIRLTPRPVGDLTSASSTIRTPYGELSSAWRVENGTFIHDIRIPVNTTAVVVLPYGGGEKEVGSGTYRFETPVK
ncbi:MAG: family 78 glycoside hydrolase catalytic domain, partial [Planctomycetia bacterium]|nr:family 78 glycoside hydrolase catalytic domain [Planctomycetia bacterium]